MIGIHIIAVGKLKEKWMRDGCDEYAKRLKLWSNVTITEIDEHRLCDNPSPAQIDECITREGSRILEKIPKGAHVVTMCIEGKMLSSEALSQHFSKITVDGVSSIVFVIGGSHGLSDSVKQISSLRLSMSPMTFPHQLARVMLLEQIYRAMSIQAGGKYHK